MTAAVIRTARPASPRCGPLAAGALSVPLLPRTPPLPHRPTQASDRTTCALPGLQPDLVAALRAAVRPGVPVVGLFVHGGAFCFLPATVAALDAMLDAWYPGE